MDVWRFTVIVIFISILASDVEYLFRCLLAFCIPSLQKCWLRYFANVLNRVCCCKNSSHILLTTALLDMLFADHFFYSVDYLFILLLVAFNVHYV